jgi:hypothetical protein
VLIKFNASFELEWVYYFPDSVGIRDESFAFSEIGNPVVLTTSQTGYEIWVFNVDGILQYFFYYNTDFSYLNILTGDFYDNSILSYNYGPDTIRIWKNNLDSGC